jgi:hypothetical protein
MTRDGAQTFQSGPRDGEPDAGELIEWLSRFQGPPQQFLENLLSVQCRLASATGGAILARGGSGRMEVLAVWPRVEPGSTAPVWLARASELAEEAASGGETMVRGLHETEDLYGQPARQHLVLIPIRGGPQGVRGLAAFAVPSSDAQAVAASRERLELTVSLLSLYEMRLTLQQRQADLNRLRQSLEVLSAVNDHDRFGGAAMALCNEVASRWGCERVSYGVLKGRYVHLKASSHTEKFSRKMKVVQDVEAAMEECLDQDVEVLDPAPPDATYVSRAAAELARLHGPATVLSLPMRVQGEPEAVLTVERPPDRPFAADEIETLRLTCDLASRRLHELHERDRWFGARAAGAVRKGLSAVLGPKHTWIKVAGIAVFAVALFLIFAKGTYHADASFVLEATKQQVVAAPFDGTLKEVKVETGDRVRAGETVLAELDTTELKVRLADAKARRLEALTGASTAMDKERFAEAQMARARADQAAAQMELLQHRIDQAVIVSNITGTVIVGDLERREGSRVQTGEVLFEVATIESLRAELAVSEDQIADVDEGDTGTLALEGDPANRLDFEVERINPVAEVVDQKNVFKVRARLLETHGRLRPGMEGVAKIDLDRRRYAWIWTRKLRNWLRMKLWI